MILANVRYRPMSSSVRLSSVTFLRPTQGIEIFRNVSMPFNTMASADIQVKFYGDRPRGTPPSGEVKDKRGSRI